MPINGSLQFGHNQTAPWVRTMQDNTDPVFKLGKLGTKLGHWLYKIKERIYKKKKPKPELTKIGIVSYSNKLHIAPYPVFLSI